MRLDKFLSQSLSITRSEAKKLIRSGRVALSDGTIARADLRLELQHVLLDGAPVEGVDSRPTCVAFHKPAGVECSQESAHYPVVYDLLPRQFRQYQIAGRLDADTTGLVLLTNDGALNHAITHPSKNSRKQYLVTVKHPISDTALTQLSEGVVLNDSHKPTRPASAIRIGTNQLELTIREGRFHQVKRMLAAVSNRVTALHRQAVGSIHLDIAEGEWRALTQHELDSFND